MMPNRGDLGFIPNNRLQAPNRGFFGAPGHSSKKGVAAIGPSKVSTFETDTPNVKPGLGLQSEEMISKRTDYLELQERRLTATMSETRSDTNRISEEVKQTDSFVKNEVNKAKDYIKSLYNDIQHVYGMVSEQLLGIECPDGRCDTVLQTYKNKPSADSLVPIACDKQWVMLVYPMIEVSVSDTKTQCFMKCKSVDVETGQLSMSWVVVFEKSPQHEKKFISEFSLLTK